MPLQPVKAYKYSRVYLSILRAGKYLPVIMMALASLAVNSLMSLLTNIELTEITAKTTFTTESGKHTPDPSPTCTYPTSYARHINHFMWYADRRRSLDPCEHVSFGHPYSTSVFK